MVFGMSRDKPVQRLLAICVRIRYYYVIRVRECFLPSIVLLPTYYSTHLALAIGVSRSGSGIGLYLVKLTCSDV